MKQPPLLHRIEHVVADFRVTNLYTDDFLSDLEEGLQQSSYATQHTLNHVILSAATDLCMRDETSDSSAPASE